MVRLENKTRLYKAWQTMNTLFYKLKNWKAYKDKLYRKLFSLSAAMGMVGGFLSFDPEVHGRYYSFEEGRWYDLGLLSCKLVTDAGVAYMVDDFDTGAAGITDFNYHDSGTGVVAENVTDTGLGTPTAEARDSGTKSQPIASQFRTVATHTYAGTFAVTEHGVFSASTAGTLWDRSVFSAINVISGDKIEFSYTLTITAGG